MRVRGTIIRYNTERGYGFISQPGQRDVFFHCREVAANESCIAVGAEVEFRCTQDAKGLRAVEVVLI